MAGELKKSPPKRRVSSRREVPISLTRTFLRCAPLPGYPFMGVDRRQPLSHGCFQQASA
jgi:hypothetical protein